MKVPIADQIQELRDELQMREYTYPARIDKHLIPKHHADEKMARLRSAIKTLEWVEANAETIRAAHHAALMEIAGRVTQAFPGAMVAP